MVSVVFADVVGFTSLSEARDPEQVKHIVDRCFTRLAEVVVSYGGRVDKIIGDAILALFGAPVAHEDDPERAVRAALAMQEAMLSEFPDLHDTVRLRIGVNTGEVLVGAMQAGGDYTAMGDVVNTANRLQVAAQPGEVLVGSATYASTRRVIGYAERGVVAAKGKEAPVQAWLAVAPVTVPGSRQRLEGVPLVGRDSELQVLVATAETALGNARGALLLLQGEAGSGKTRLASELARTLVDGSGALVLEGRCVPYGEANAWFPVAEALRSLLDLPPGASFDRARVEVRGVIGDAVGGSLSRDELERTCQGVLQVFGYDEARVGFDPDRAHNEVVRAVGVLFRTLTQTRPVVVQLSDLHWADPVVLELFAGLLHALARAPFILVGTTRRSLLDRWSPPVGRFDTVALNVDMLDRSATEALLEHLLRVAGHSDLSAEDRDVLLERSGGNPMFLSELVAVLDDDRAALLPNSSALGDLPDTLRGLVAARLDRLRPPERAVVDDASVLGRRGLVFHLREMARLIRGVDDIDGALSELAVRDVMRVEGDHWEFHNDLTREVAYHTLTKVDRANRHLGVARWIEAHHQGAWSDGQVDLLAHHYGLAAELLADVGAVDQLQDGLRDRALHWVNEAAGRAERLSLLRSVTRLTGQGLALAPAGPSPLRFELLLRRARAEAELRQVVEATADLDAADEVAEALADDAARASVLVVRGDLFQKQGMFDSALATLDAAVAAYEAVGDVDGRGEALRTRALGELMAGHLDSAEESARSALEAFRASGRLRGEAWALQNLAWIALMRGQGNAAQELVSQSLAVFDQLGDSGGAAWARGVQGFVLYQLGDLRAAEECQREVLEEVRVRGDRWALGMMLLLGAGLSLWTGRTQEAVEQAEEGMAVFRQLNDRFGTTRIAWPLGRALVMRGRVAEGVAALESAQREALAGTTEDRVVTSVALAATETHLGRPERSLAALDVLAGDDDTVGVGWTDRDTALALALLQVGRVAEARALVFAAALGREVHGPEGLAASAVGALVCAASADERDRGEPLESLVAAVDGDDRASYLDRIFVAVARGLVAARGGRAAESASVFATAIKIVDNTGDLLTQAIVRLAEGRALEVLGDGDSLEVMAEAWARLHGLGIDGAGWVTAFDAALGVLDHHG